MFEAGGFGVAVTVAPTAPPAADFLQGPRAAGVSRRASRLTDLLNPAEFDDAGIATQLSAVRGLRAQLAAYEAALVTQLATRRPAANDLTGGQPGAAVEGWVPDRAPVGVSEFLADELALLADCSRAAALGLAERSIALVREVPAVWEALADERIDEPRARAIVAVLRGQSVDAGGPVDPEVVTEVAARALEWATAGELPARLRERTAAALLQVDAAAADRRRKRAERNADVSVRVGRDGMAELVADMAVPVAGACRDAVDGYARMWRADGDTRPIGRLRALVLADLILRPWDTSRPPVTAHLEVVAPLGGLAPEPPHPPHGDPAHPAHRGAGSPVHLCAAPEGAQGGQVAGLPVSAAQLRKLLTRLDALCPGGLQAPAGGSLDIALVDPHTGALRATVTRAELARLLRRGCRQHPGPASEACACPVLDRPPPVDRYEPTPAQRRFVRARDRTCRHPGCRRPAGRTDLDHVVPYDDGGPTECDNLCCLCRRHHRLKTHAPGWRYRMSPDGVLEVTTPSGVTRCTRPPGLRLPEEWMLTLVGAASLTNTPAADEPPPF